MAFLTGVLEVKSTWLAAGKEAATRETLSVNSFKTSYVTMLNYYKQSRKIQLFGGGLTLAEFDDASGNIYAGHLGSFWAPPLLCIPYY